MIKELLREAQQRVIDPLQEKNKFVSKGKLKRRRRYFSQKLSEIWEDEDIIAKEDKFEEGDIFEYPYAAVYLLYCFPVPLETVIQDPTKADEFWDFYLDEHPEIKFGGNIQQFYKALRAYRNKK